LALALYSRCLVLQTIGRFEESLPAWAKCCFLAPAEPYYPRRAMQVLLDATHLRMHGRVMPRIGKAQRPRFKPPDCNLGDIFPPNLAPLVRAIQGHFHEILGELGNAFLLYREAWGFDPRSEDHSADMGRMLRRFKELGPAITGKEVSLIRIPRAGWAAPSVPNVVGHPKPGLIDYLRRSPQTNTIRLPGTHRPEGGTVDVPDSIGVFPDINDPNYSKLPSVGVGTTIFLPETLDNMNAPDGYGGTLGVPDTDMVNGQKQPIDAHNMLVLMAHELTHAWQWNSGQQKGAMERVTVGLDPKAEDGRKWAMRFIPTVIASPVGGPATNPATPTTNPTTGPIIGPMSAAEPDAVRDENIARQRLGLPVRDKYTGNPVSGFQNLPPFPWAQPTTKPATRPAH